MNEKGEILYNQKLNEIETQNRIILNAYKYSEGIYYFVIGYNKSNYPNNFLSLYYYNITYKNNNEYKIELIFKQEEFHPNLEKEYNIVVNGLACQSMNYNSQKVLTCLFNKKHFK